MPYTQTQMDNLHFKISKIQKIQMNDYVLVSLHSLLLKTEELNNREKKLSKNKKEMSRHPKILDQKNDFIFRRIFFLCYSERENDYNSQKFSDIMQ